jgi:hypothetical protein
MIAKTYGPSEVYEQVWEGAIGPSIRRAMQEVDDLKKNPPHRLLHFTSAAGLAGILRTNQLRLCRARSSNDPSEMAYGLDLARAEAMEVLDGRSAWDRHLAEALSASFAGQLLDGSSKPLADPYICCFSLPECESSVEQWALYGRSAGGFALVFDGPAMAAGQAGLVPVTYDVAAQRARMKGVIQRAKETCAEARRLAEPHGEDHVNRMHLIAGHAFGSVAGLHASTMKADGFKFEQEWRLIVYTLPESMPDLELPLKYRVEAAGRHLRGFYEYPFEPQSLKEIIVGQSGAELHAPVVETFVRENKEYGHVEVRVGNVALRSFD